MKASNKNLTDTLKERLELVKTKYVFQELKKYRGKLKIKSDPRRIKEERE